MARQSKPAGIVLILCASFVWAVETVLVKIIYRGGGDFLLTAEYRAVFMCVIGLAYALVTDRSSIRLKPKEFGAVAYIAVAGTLVADLLYYFALTRVPVMNAVLIGHMQPVFIVLFGLAVHREEKPTWLEGAGILVMIVAGLCVTTATPANLLKLKLGTAGDLLVLGSTVAWATTSIAMRKYIPSVNAGAITFYRYLIAAVVFGLVLVFRNELRPPVTLQVLLGLVMGAGSIFYYEGMRRMRAALVSATELSTPLFAALLAFFILGETVTWMQGAGVFLLVLGVYFLSRKPRSDSHAV